MFAICPINYLLKPVWRWSFRNSDGANNPKHSSITVDGKEITVDGMFDELSKVMELQKKMNEVFKNSTLNPADFQDTQDKACFQILLFIQA